MSRGSQHAPIDSTVGRDPRRRALVMRSIAAREHATDPCMR
jgi:hypothetical protein